MLLILMLTLGLYHLHQKALGSSVLLHPLVFFTFYLTLDKALLYSVLNKRMGIGSTHHYIVYEHIFGAIVI